VPDVWHQDRKEKVVLKMKAESGEAVYQENDKRYVIRWTDKPPGQQEPVKVEVE
jgi:hypothetical protein